MTAQIEYQRAEGIAWDFLASLRQRFDAYAEKVTTDPAATDEDWRLAFLEDVNEVLVMLANVENRLSRVERNVHELIKGWSA